MYLFYFFAAVLVFLGYKSLRGGFLYLGYFQQELARSKRDFTPFVSIFAPCRGLDQNLRINLSALFQQKYPAFEIIFAVGDESDGAIPVIGEFLGGSENQPESKLVIAGAATDEGQKVHNLRSAVQHASDKSEIFVFVDSDARPSVDWLENLVAPLADEMIGCATGYRWFIAEKRSFSAQVRSVWNASIASALGANTKSNFCWGGATAIRRETFEKIDMRSKWRGTLSDDFAMTRAVKSAGLLIYFVPQCLTPTVEKTSFREVLEFTTRQMKITRAYAPNLWIASMIGSGLFTVTFLSGIVLLFFRSGAEFFLTLAFLTVISILGAAKAKIRLDAVKLVLKEYKNELDESLKWHLVLWLVSSALFFYNGLMSLFSNVIVWRGIRYKLAEAEKIEILSVEK